MRELAAVIGTLVAGLTALIWLGIAKLQQPYVEACRDAGGIVIRVGGSLNCARPGGGWIDVR